MVPEPLRYDQSSNYAPCQTAVCPLFGASTREANPAAGSVWRSLCEKQRSVGAHHELESAGFEEFWHLTPRRSDAGKYQQACESPHNWIKLGGELQFSARVQTGV